MQEIANSVLQRVTNSMASFPLTKCNCDTVRLEILQQLVRKNESYVVYIYLGNFRDQNANLKLV